MTLLTSTIPHLVLCVANNNNVYFFDKLQPCILLKSKLYIDNVQMLPIDVIEKIGIYYDVRDAINLATACGIRMSPATKLRTCDYITRVTNDIRYYEFITDRFAAKIHRDVIMYHIKARNVAILRHLLAKACFFWDINVIKLAIVMDDVEVFKCIFDVVPIEHMQTAFKVDGDSIVRKLYKIMCVSGADTILRWCSTQPFAGGMMAYRDLSNYYIQKASMAEFDHPDIKFNCEVDSALMSPSLSPIPFKYIVAGTHISAGRSGRIYALPPSEIGIREHILKEYDRVLASGRKRELVTFVSDMLLSNNFDVPTEKWFVTTFPIDEYIRICTNSVDIYRTMSDLGHTNTWIVGGGDVVGSYDNYLWCADKELWGTDESAVFNVYLKSEEDYLERWISTNTMAALDLTKIDQYFIKSGIRSTRLLLSLGLRPIDFGAVFEQSLSGKLMKAKLLHSVRPAGYVVDKQVLLLFMHEYNDKVMWIMDTFAEILRPHAVAQLINAITRDNIDLVAHILKRFNLTCRCDNPSVASSEMQSVLHRLLL